jgi:hypothetical protein
MTAFSWLAQWGFSSVVVVVVVEVTAGGGMRTVDCELVSVLVFALSSPLPLVNDWLLSLVALAFVSTPWRSIVCRVVVTLELGPAVVRVVSVGTGTTGRFCAKANPGLSANKVNPANSFFITVSDTSAMRTRLTGRR